MTSFWGGSCVGLEKEVNSTEFWKKMADPEFISDEELWALRYKLRRELIEFARRKMSQGLSQSDFIAFDQLLNSDALTIGFARRFATYKRAPLIFDHFDDMVKLMNDRRHPIQFIFAGKAHPRDDDGKRYIQRIIHLSKFSELKGTWSSSRTTTFMSPAKWFPAATSGLTIRAGHWKPPAPAA